LVQRVRAASQFVLSALKPFIVACVYSLIGASIFMLLEADDNRRVKVERAKARLAARRELMFELVRAQLRLTLRFNVLFYETHPQYVDKRLYAALLRYEQSIGLDAPQFNYSKIESDWDIWNGLLYAGTIYTTIGEFLTLI